MTQRHTKYGWRRDLPDRRDRKLRYVPGLESMLPKAADLTPKMPPVYAQGYLGSCTSQAVCSVLHYRELNDDNVRTIVPSRLFTYYNTRVLENCVNEDAGCSLRETVKSVATYGVCDEALWPYDPLAYARRPAEPCYEQARKYKVVDYVRVEQNPAAIKACLAAGDPIAFGIAVYAELENSAVAQTGIVPLPRDEEVCLGGHAIVLVGYDDAKGLFKFRNSWGADWGDRGYGYLQYKYVLDSDLAADFWSVKAIPAQETP